MRPSLGCVREMLRNVALASGQTPPRGHSFKGLAPAEGPDAFRWENRGLPQVQINMHFLLIA